MSVALACPSLVCLGTTEDAEVYLDLEAAGVVTLAGPPEVTAALARSVVATLAVSPLADLVNVVTTGVECFGFASEERVHAVSDADAALDVAAALSSGVRRVLASAGAPSTLQLRLDAPEEPWEPVVAVLTATELSDREQAEMRRLVSAGGVAVVTDTLLPDAPVRLQLAADGWRLDPLGITVPPRGLAATELAAISALLVDAASPAVPIGRAPVDDRHARPFLEPEWALLVRLIGPVDVVDRHGRAADFERSKATELVAWLAEHRANPSRMGARTALWESDVRDATFANVVSDARRALARLVPPPDGEDWIARAFAERLPLHPLVLTDGDLVAARLKHAEQQVDAAAVETLREALALVRDAPYAGARYLWPDGEALPSRLTLLVTNAASEMAERCLALGDGDGAFWATSQGLKVLPGHDELVCLRMRAHALAGNLAGVRREFEGYERVVTSDPWGDGQASPKVVALRNQLLAPSGRTRR